MPKGPGYVIEIGSRVRVVKDYLHATVPDTVYTVTGHETRQGEKPNAISRLVLKHPNPNAFFPYPRAFPWHVTLVCYRCGKDIENNSEYFNTACNYDFCSEECAQADLDERERKDEDDE